MRDSIGSRMTRRLIEMGYGTRVTGEQLCQMYVEEGGRKRDGTRRDLGVGSTMFRLQGDLPIRRVAGLDGFGVKNVYVVDADEAHRLGVDRWLRSRPSALWKFLETTLKKED